MKSKLYLIILLLTGLILNTVEAVPFRPIATVNGTLAGEINPSLLGETKKFGFTTTFNSNIDDGEFRNDNDDYSFLMHLGGLGFGYSKFNTNEEYFLSNGTKIYDGVYIGSSITWFGSSNLNSEYGLSATYRPYSFLSIAAKSNNLFQNNNHGINTSLGFGVRPFGNKITLNTDISFEKENIDKSDYTAGIEAEIIDGLSLRADYSSNFEDSDNPTIGVGLNLSFGSSSMGSYANFDKNKTGGMSSYISFESENAHKLINFNNSKIVKIKLGGSYKEEKSSVSIFNLFGKSSQTVSELIKDINRLANDNEVAGIVIDASDISISFAAAEEVINALQKFKNKGKKIITYFTTLSQKTYFLISLSNKIYIYPDGMLSLEGLGVEMSYYKDLLAKIGISMQVARHGKYKSAVEMFTRTSPSEADNEQLSELLKSLDDLFKEQIAKGRSFSVAELNDIIDTMPFHSAKSALKYKLVDAVLYKDKLDETVKNDIAKDASIVDGKNYFMFDTKDYAWNCVREDKIAVIYATGSIVTGKSTSSDGIIPIPFISGAKMGSETTTDMIRNARNNKNVKAIVLRVDSGGGSALASDIILHELLLAQNENKKPVIISMGGVAASGGYMISAYGDRIFADRGTITGSIGVFGMFPSLKGLYGKLGINHQKIKMNKFAKFSSINSDLDTNEKAIFQNFIDESYDDFITLVAKGRKMNKNKVNDIAQGRVWGAADALKIGLVDEIGGLDKAIKYAADQVKLENPKIKIYTKGLKFEIGGTVSDVMGFAFSDIKEIKKAITDLNSNTNGIYKKMPYDIIIK